jgi:hypothetical protein
VDTFEEEEEVDIPPAEEIEEIEAEMIQCRLK